MNSKPSLASEMKLFNTVLALGSGKRVIEHVNSERTALTQFKKIVPLFSGGIVPTSYMFYPSQTDRFATRQEHIDCMVGSNYANCQGAHYFAEEYELLKKIYETGVSGASLWGKDFVPCGSKYHRLCYYTMTAKSLKGYTQYSTEKEVENFREFLKTWIPEVQNLDVPFYAFFTINNKKEIGVWACIADKEFKSNKRKSSEELYSVYAEYCKVVFGTQSTSDFSDFIFQYKKNTNIDIRTNIATMKKRIADPKSVEIAPATAKQIKMIKNIAPSVDADKLNKYQASEIISSYYDYDGEYFDETVKYYEK